MKKEIIKEELINERKKEVQKTRCFFLKLFGRKERKRERRLDGGDIDNET